MPPARTSRPRPDFHRLCRLRERRAAFLDRDRGGLGGDGLGLGSDSDPASAGSASGGASIIAGSATEGAGAVAPRRRPRVLRLGFRARFLGLQLDQALPVGDGDLVVVGVDFAEREEAVAAAAIFHESRLQRRLHADHFGEVDVSL